MSKTLFFLIPFLLFVSACSQKSPHPSQKVFAQEDLYIMYALDAEKHRDYNSAIELYEILYKKSGKKEYLYRELENMIVAKEYGSVIKKVDATVDDDFEDVKLTRLKIVALIESGELKKAKALAVKLARETQDANDYILAADAFIKNREYDLAVRYLDSAYMQEYNEKILDKISIILYVNMNRPKEAIARLETHSRIHGCSQTICNRLIGFYSHENNVNGLLSVYKRLYEKNKNEAVAQKIIQIYSYKREYLKLIDFLEESHANDNVLLELYVAAKNYKKASKLAYKLYTESGDYRYLGQSAIYKYEAQKGKISKRVLKDVVERLTKVTKHSKETLYLNYLGYILIDHELDVKKGISYIKEVLKKQPDSAYYLDSLAWGYYKLHQCNRAKKIMQRVVKLEGGDDAEVLLHLKKINNCLKKRKSTRKRVKEAK